MPKDIFQLYTFLYETYFFSHFSTNYLPSNSNSSQIDWFRCFLKGYRSAIVLVRPQSSHIIYASSSSLAFFSLVFIAKIHIIRHQARIHVSWLRPHVLHTHHVGEFGTCVPKSQLQLLDDCLELGQMLDAWINVNIVGTRVECHNIKFQRTP